MADLRIKTITGVEAVAQQAALEALKGNLRGELLTSESPDHDEARAIWNAMIDRRPALIIRCVGTADVMRAVDFARRNELVVAVRGGGHNIAGNAVCDGGLMIDLSPMKSVRVNHKYASKLPSRHCEVFIGLIGGQASRGAPDETAYSHRDAKFVLNVHGRWERAEDDRRCI